MAKKVEIKLNNGAMPAPLVHLTPAGKVLIEFLDSTELGEFFDIPFLAAKYGRSGPTQSKHMQLIPEEYRYRVKYNRVEFGSKESVKWRKEVYDNEKDN